MGQHRGGDGQGDRRHDAGRVTPTRRRGRLLVPSHVQIRARLLEEEADFHAADEADPSNDALLAAGAVGSVEAQVSSGCST